MDTILQTTLSIPFLVVNVYFGKSFFLNVLKSKEQLVTNGACDGLAPNGPLVQMMLTKISDPIWQTVS